MFDTRLFGYNLLVLLVFILHQQLDIAKAEDISSEFETDFEDDISFQQRTTTPTTTSSPTKYYKDYYQDEVASQSDTNDDLTLSNSGSFSNNPVLYGYSKTQSDEDNQRRMNKASPPSYGNVSNSPKEWMSNTKKLVHSNFEKHKSHHRNYRRYGHKSHKKSYSKYKKYDHLRGKHKLSTHNTFNQKPYYQGQVTYYGDTDSADGTFHSATKMKSHRYQHNNRGSSRSGGATDRHHINGPNDYIRNSKWPHLSRVQYQLFEDEKQEIEEDLPPYIKKYNRRNKQLLDLLEGTLPPPTPPQHHQQQQQQPQHHHEHQIASGTRKREKTTQHRYHNRKNPKWIIEDLFEEQRANPNNPNKEDDQYMDDSAVSSVPVKPAEVLGESNEMKIIENNELPGDNMDVSQDMEGHQLKTVSAEIGDSSGSGIIMGNGGGVGTIGSIGGASSSSSSSSISNNDKGEQEKNVRQSSLTSSVATPHDEFKVSPKANKFIYHRVASPRVVGTGGGAGIGGSKKQRLPFVAITDRRLETSKMRQKDFEQNHLPLP